MLYGVYLSATGMAMNQNQQDVIANNLANVNTVGFKRDFSVFKQRLQEAQTGGNRRFLMPDLQKASGGAFVARVQTDYSQGNLEMTNRNLDLAVNGPGFLMVQDRDVTRYTRDGRLTVVDGQLVRQTDGKPILDDSGKDIQVPADATAQDLRIDGHGNVWCRGQQVAELGRVSFAEPEKLVKIGGNLFDAAGQEPETSETPLVSGTVEASTVSPTMEMVEMIRVSRNYQLNAEMISLQDQSLSRLVNDLPRL
jgi:flagellar basal-body rod protein FlgF